MADIFISYSKDDEHLARPLAQALVEVGYTTWWWGQKMIGGQHTRRDVNREISAAGLVIVIWTANSVKSEEVQREARRAYWRNKLFPVRTHQFPIDSIPRKYSRIFTPTVEDVAGCVAQIKEALYRKRWRRHAWRALVVTGIAGGIFAALGKDVWVQLKPHALQLLEICKTIIRW